MNPWEAPQDWRGADHRYLDGVASGPVPNQRRKIAKALLFSLLAAVAFVCLMVGLMYLGFSNDGPSTPARPTPTRPVPAVQVHH